MFNVDTIRKEFPILQREVHGKPLIYLDNAATTQKPQCVIDSLTAYYTSTNSNVHRGAHCLADEATRAYEATRARVAGFINAGTEREIIWTSGTTEGINIIARGMADRLASHQNVIISEMEHHANLIPWQQACQRSGAELRIAPINEAGEIDLDALAMLIDANTALLSVAHISNALGTINPVKKIGEMLKSGNPSALFMIDGAQGIAHGDVDVQALGSDFYTFSGHKVFGPTGVGVLWGRESVLADWPVWQTGGEMNSSVTYQSAEWNVLPSRLEAGTPNIAGVIALGTAIDWLGQQDLDGLRAHEQQLIRYADERAATVSGLRQIGTAQQRIGVLSFVLSQGHAADVGFLLDRQGIAIRTGNHCAEPLMHRYGLSGSARASFSIYNTLDEIELLFNGIEKAKMMLE